VIHTLIDARDRIDLVLESTDDGGLDDEVVVG